VTGAELIAVSVVENNFVNGLPLDDEVYQLNQILKEKSEENLKEFDKLNEDNLKITHIVREGSPAKVILEVAKEEEIDLIVMGSSGKSGFDRFIMGSVADKVVNSAKCAVLVVH
ncbi:MAG: universal stress protein, partial [Methanobrevibacter sp.]|nr:universal stress protein [Methanobrevibacter sp.]